MKKHKNSSAHAKSTEQKQAAIQQAAKQKVAKQQAGQGSLAELSWPAITAGVGAMVILSLLTPVDSISVFMGTALPQNLAWLALAACAALASRNSMVRFEPSRVELVFVGSGLMWLIMASWMASANGDSRAVWNGFWQVISLGSCFYIARGLVQFARVRAALVLLLVIGCVSLSMQGLEQVLVSMPASRAEYLKDPERMLMEQGIDAPPDSPRRKQFEDRLNSPEPFATFALTNSLATLLSLGVMLNSGLLLSSVVRGRAKRVANESGSVNWIRTSALAGMLAVQLICLLLTRSRTAYLALVVSLGAWLLLELVRGKVQLSRRSLQIGGGVIAAGLILGLGWLLTIDSLVWSEAPKSISYRLEYWQATLQMIRDQAWTGVGLGNFQNYYPQYKLEQASEIIADPHNWLLDIAATLSLPIALLILGWLGVTVLKALSRCLSELSTSRLPVVALDQSVALQESRWQQERQEQRLVLGLFGGAGVGGFAAASLLSLLGSLDFQITVTAWSMAASLGCLVWWSTSRLEKLENEDVKAESAKEMSRVKFPVSIVAAGREPSGSVTPDGLRPAAKEGINFGTVPKDEGEAEGSSASSEANLLATVLVVLLCLLASGSWQASGIAVPFLILVAMHWRTRPSGVNAMHAKANTNAKKVISMTTAAIACVAILIFIQQTWRPVTEGWVLDEQATSARSLGEQLRLIELAAAADPLDVERKVQVVQLKGIQVGSIQDSAKFAKEAELLLAELSALSPPDVVGYLTPKLAGQISFDLAANAASLGLPNKIYLAAAKGFYSQAVERYPSSVELLVQLAAVAAVDEDWLLAASSVQRGTEVSDRSPHLDKKLATQLIWLPLRPAGYESQTGYVPAEPLAVWLRTQSKAAPPQ